MRVYSVKLKKGRGRRWAAGERSGSEENISYSERMSPVDTTWLRMDHPANLMVIVAVC